MVLTVIVAQLVQSTASVAVWECASVILAEERTGPHTVIWLKNETFAKGNISHWRTVISNHIYGKVYSCIDVEGHELLWRGSLASDLFSDRTRCCFCLPIHLSVTVVTLVGLWFLLLSSWMPRLCVKEEQNKCVFTCMWKSPRGLL